MMRVHSRLFEWRIVSLCDDAASDAIHVIPSALRVNDRRIEVATQARRFICDHGIKRNFFVTLLR
jgi:hypothetical protein